MTDNYTSIMDIIIRNIRYHAEQSSPEPELQLYNFITELDKLNRTISNIANTQAKRMVTWDTTI